MINLQDEGNSFRGIANILNQQGLLNRSGGNWDKTTVGTIIAIVFTILSGTAGHQIIRAIKKETILKIHQGQVRNKSAVHPIYY